MIKDKPEIGAQDLGFEGLEDQSRVVGPALKSHGPYINITSAFNWSWEQGYHIIIAELFQYL